jgi:hypothetical protein
VNVLLLALSALLVILVLLLLLLLPPRLFQRLKRDWSAADAAAPL